MGFDLVRIDAALTPLIGLPIWSTARAADLQSFQIGARRVTVVKHGPRAGQLISVGDYALHVQCAWRIVGPTGTVAGWPDTPESDRRDAQVVAWLRDTAYTIESVTADPVGGCTLGLEGGFALQVFPHDLVPGDVIDAEYWRLLRPRSGEPHFVVTAAGIEE